MFTFTFNMVNSSDMGLLVKRVDRAIMPPLSRARQAVTGMPGSYLMMTNIGERVIECKVYYKASTYEDATVAMHALSEWLYTTEPVELTLSDDPGRTYYAILSGSTDLEETVMARTGTLRFLCTDPYAYGPETVIDIEAVGETAITDGGNAYPVIGVELDGDTTFVEVRCTDTGEFVRFGTPTDVDVTPTDPTTLEFNDDCSEMDWTPSTVTRNGTTTLPTDLTNPMVMVVNAAGDAFSPGSAGGSYGTGAAWHGPTVLRSLSSAATDFSVTARFKLLDTPAAVGRAELILLDASDNIIGFVGVKDASGSVDDTYWESASAPDTGIVTSRVELKPDNSIYEYDLSIQRVGTRWTAGQELISGYGGIWNPSSRSWTGHTTAVAKVGIHIAANASHTPAVMHCSNVLVRHLNTVGADDTPVVAYAGDVVTFDMRQAIVTVNGSQNSIVSDVNGNLLPVSALLDLRSSFFALPAGATTISVSADAGVTVTGTITYKPRYL